MFEHRTDFYFNGKTLPDVELLTPITLSTPFPSPIDFTTDAALPFLGSQTTQILRFFIVYNMRIVRDRA